MLPTLLLLLFAPDCSKLGADEYRVREAETRRCDNPLSAALLPDRTDSPEADARIAALKRKHRPLTQRQVEVRILDDDFPRWVELYLKSNRSAIARDFDFYATEVLNRPEHYVGLFTALPRRPDMQWNFWCGPITPRDFPAWLDYLDYHQGVAPAPREANPSP